MACNASASECPLDLRFGSTVLLQLNNLVDDAGAAVVGATVEATITDQATGGPIANITNPVAMPSPGSDNNYQATLPANAGWTVGQRISVVITATSGPIVRRFADVGLVCE